MMPNERTWKARQRAISIRDIAFGVWLFGGLPAFALITWSLVVYRPEFWPFYVMLAFMIGGFWQSVAAALILYEAITGNPV